MDDESKIKKALLKKALGYIADDVVEEFLLDEDGNIKLSKKKVTKKHYPPDIMAIKVLFDKYFKTYSEEISSMSDEELIAERERLLKALKEENNGTF